ncbi:MAG: CoA-binding protein [Candidatus Altiarchaeota archaeon]
MESIAIVGASKDRKRFSNKAVRAYVSKGYRVFPVNPKEKEVEGIPCHPSVLDVPEHIDSVSFYVNPAIGLGIADDVIQRKIRRVYLNPGSESAELAKKLKEAGIETLLTCSILAIGINPQDL